MKKVFPLRKLCLTAAAIILTTFAFAQTRLSGRVTDALSRGELAGISLAVKGKVIGTITDTKGAFTLSTNTATPFTLVVSGVGYKSQQFEITASRTDLNVVLEEQITLGQEVVVSASRVAEDVLKSPVSVEKLDIRALQSAPAVSAYDALATLKGVDMATQGFLFKSINLRGFGSTGNPRTVQLIDGMDNSAPGLNFPIDNIVGIPDLDLESVEILPGAASALYGPNAIQGLVLMNSKSPFLYQGLSANIKTGVMSASNRNVTTTGFYDASIRYAKAFNNRLAFKLNLSYIRANDWQATDYTNLNILNGVAGPSDPTRGAGTALSYDGMNAYGDENVQSITGIGNVSRTGFIERDLVDYNTKSFKVNGAVHYRLSDKIEAVAQVNYGTGTTIYTGTGRYSLRDFALTQAKLELRGDNFTLRAYTTQEQSGKSYTAGLTAVAMNELWKPSSKWFPEYAAAYAAARAANQDVTAADVTARAKADVGRPVPGTQAFTDLLDQVRNKPISQGGSAFTDNSALYHLDGLYNFKNQIKFADVQVGANYRSYVLASDATLFADKAEGRTGSITISEYGAFAQVAKSLLDNHLRLTGSVRYDKNQNFAGQFTPRVSAVGTFGDQNIRVSYQTGFRIPTTQNQYIDLQTPQARLIGGLPEFDSRYNLANSYSLPNVTAYGAAVLSTAQSKAFQDQVIPGLTQQLLPLVRSSVEAAVTAQVQAAVAAGQIPAANAPAAIAAAVAAALPGEVQKAVTSALPLAAATANLGLLKPYQTKEFKTERVSSIEVGYRGLVAKRLLVDAYYYSSEYTNFLGGVVLIQPTAPLAAGFGLDVRTGVIGGSTTRNVFSRPANSSKPITTNGFGLGLTYQLPKAFSVGGNIANNKLNGFESTEEVQFAGFNTPEYRWNLSFGKRVTAASKIGFSLNFKHQDAFLWEAGFSQPSISTITPYTNTTVPAINNFDAQVSYKLQPIKSIVKIGGTNIGGNPYIQAFGSASVGSMYYIGITFDELLN